MVRHKEELLSGAERELVRDCALSAARGNVHAEQFADACEYFFLFRKLHRAAEMFPEWAVLTGDYYFSRFSHALIPLDNVELTDRFSAYLKKDASGKKADLDLAEYLEFIRQTALETGL